MSLLLLRLMASLRQDDTYEKLPISTIPLSMASLESRVSNKNHTNISDLNQDQPPNTS